MFLQDECFAFQDACFSFDLLLCPFGVEWRREIERWRERVRKWERERKERGRERGKDGGGDWSVVIRVFWISMTLKKSVSSFTFFSFARVVFTFKIALMNWPITVYHNSL